MVLGLSHMGRYVGMIREIMSQIAPDIFTVIGLIYILSVSYWGLMRLKNSIL